MGKMKDMLIQKEDAMLKAFNVYLDEEEGPTLFDCAKRMFYAGMEYQRTLENAGECGREKFGMVCGDMASTGHRCC